LPRHLIDRPIFLRGGQEIEIIDRRPILVKRHDLSDASARPYLVLLIRRPLDAILSHTATMDDDRYFNNAEAQLEAWLCLLRAYNGWNPQDRHLIEYECLIKDPDRQAELLMQFLVKKQSTEVRKSSTGWGAAAVDQAKQALIRPPVSANSNVPLGFRWPCRAHILEDLMAKLPDSDQSLLDAYGLRRL